jgi:glyoxylase-like metal-dependent hydrolase (beta-lactamase superfamily II)
LIKLVDLPGHAPGQLGIELKVEQKPLLYATDAYWDSAQVNETVDLPGPILKLQWDRFAYRETIQQLRAVARAGSHDLLACHARETAALLPPAS